MNFVCLFVNKITPKVPNIWTLKFIQFVGIDWLTDWLEMIFLFGENRFISQKIPQIPKNPLLSYLHNIL